MNLLNILRYLHIMPADPARAIQEMDKDIRVELMPADRGHFNAINYNGKTDAVNTLNSSPLLALIPENMLNRVANYMYRNGVTVADAMVDMEVTNKLGAQK